MPRIIAMPIIAASLALASCAGRPADWPAPAAAPASCEDWTRHTVLLAARGAGLPPEYVGAACALGWTWAQVVHRARARGHVIGACRGSSPTARRLLHGPCADESEHAP